MINLQMVVSLSKLHASAYIIREHFEKDLWTKLKLFKENVSQLSLMISSIVDQHAYYIEPIHISCTRE